MTRAIANSDWGTSGGVEELGGVGKKEFWLKSLKESTNPYRLD
jgi:hypothetical protein